MEQGGSSILLVTLFYDLCDGLTIFKLNRRSEYRSPTLCLLMNNNCQYFLRGVGTSCCADHIARIGQRGRDCEPDLFVMGTGEPTLKQSWMIPRQEN